MKTSTFAFWIPWSLAICFLSIASGLAISRDVKLKNQPESYYQEKWCNDRGQMEVVLSDRTRCDCLTEGYAVEVEFGRNWAEAIGQSLHYAKMTGRQAGIVLIVDNQRYLDRLNGVIRYHGLPVKVWSMDK